MAYNFNGSNQYLSVLSSPVGNSLAPITMACWAKGNSAANAYIFALGSSASSNPILGLTITSNKEARVFIRADSGSSGELVGTSVVFGASTPWNHICFTNDSSARKLYVNGVEEDTDSGITTAITLNRVGIAALIRNGVGSYYGGEIASAGIYSVALTAAEVASLADGMTCDKVRPQSLVFYAPLVRDLIDYKGGLTITNNNTATVANHPRVYA